ETALNACKGSEIYTLQTGICNSEVICPQKSNHVISKKIPFILPSLSNIVLDSSANNAGGENVLEMGLSNAIPQNTATKKDYPGSGSRKSNSFCTIPSSGSTAGKESSQRKDPPLALKDRPVTALADPCCKGSCCQILACQRQTILKFMTEGRLNHILDVLRSQQTLSRMDYETITSYPTVTGRARALLDTCLCLGERAAQVVVTELSAAKRSPLARGSHWPDCSSKVNRLLL
ncbi:PREDICTED: receptor-interacting serine/threonine-protein kinase 2-like, partial [Mesitornis unicolor]|uniref:receptor-interacting serine/threonine-protein kinase 2-like n=1 Tax=Mesitornis unicolor TaxID=54374 RepID=UPI0005287C79